MRRARKSWTVPNDFQSTLSESSLPSAGAQREPRWHARRAEDVLAAFGTGLQGLTAQEAASRKERFGANRLAAARKRSEILRFLSQVNNVLIYVLLLAACFALAIGHVADAIVILAVVLLNAVVGYIQEGRAARALDAIRRMIDPRATVIREGRRATIAAEDIVPGDIVVLEPGDRVPADLRLIRSRNLRIDEAALTGESVPVDKIIATVDAKAALADRTCMAYSGTFVVGGNGIGVAVATGPASELGRIGALVGRIETLTTPLIRQMNELARKLTVFILAVSTAVFAYSILVSGYHWQEAFMVMIGLAVAAIPEGLPAVMTITLAIGVQRMAERNAIVRRLPAVETLGSVSVICSDKTGTLTRNEMTVRSVLTREGLFDVTGTGYCPEGEFELDGRLIDPAGYPILMEAARAAVLCNDAELRVADGTWVVHGDPMEGALLSFGIKAGYDFELLRRQLPRTDEIPFDTQHKFMATLHHGHENGPCFVIVKGAPERLLAMCSRQRGVLGDEPLDGDFWHDRTQALARQGRRMLAVAIKSLPTQKRDLSFSDVENDGVFLCLLGLIDPPREEVPQAIEECRKAGICVKMITGDHVATAEAIARELRLADKIKSLTGQAIDRLDDAQLKEVALDVSVFARTSPEHKLRLVEALQANGMVTAMTGDGVNDAPALKRADIGVAMGRKGTEAAKEAAELVLADDNFASIVAAVREGRTVYDNLRKLIAWTLPTNGGEAAAIIAAIAFGLTLPVTPIQILWINLVTAVTLGLTFAFEPTEPEAMRRPPRKREEMLLSPLLLWRVGFVSFLFVAGAFGVLAFAVSRGSSIELARTMVVNTIVVMEIFYLFSVRFIHGTSLTWRGVLGTPAVLIALITVVAAQFAFTYVPVMQTTFETESISLPDAALIVAAGMILLLIVELEKRVASVLLRWVKAGQAQPVH